MNSAYAPTPTVMAFKDIAFHGNIIPMPWYKHLTMEDGKPNLPAIIILSDIVYWYRPTEVRDEITGQLVGYKSKFKSDKLQRSYDQMAEQFGLTKRQAKDAINYLISRGAVTREFRTVPSASGAMLGNVMFVEPVPAVIRKLNDLPVRQAQPYNVITPDPMEDTPPYDVITTEGDRYNDTPLSFKRQTLTESTTETTTKTTTTPYPLSDEGPGPYGNDWDPAEADQLERYDGAGLDDGGQGGGGGDEGDEWDLPATPLKPIERVVIGGLVGGGGDWDAEQYERLAAGGVVVAPQSAPPPTAAPDISWAECEAALGAPEINVQYPGYLRTCGLPYRAIVRKARQLAKGGAGGGAIVKWFKNPENIEALRVELARPVAQTVAVAAEPEGPAPAQLLKQRPAWCSEQAWRGCEPALKVKLQEATLELTPDRSGWLWTSSRRQQDAINGKYRNAIIAVLQQSGIQPTPPPPPAAVAAPSAWGGRAAA